MEHVDINKFVDERLADPYATRWPGCICARHTASNFEKLRTLCCSYNNRRSNGTLDEVHR